MKTVVVNVNVDGGLEFIYSDATADLVGEHRGPNPPIRRASHVEPTADGRWQADLAPVEGPVLGPFKKRQEALESEVAWLLENVMQTTK